MTLYEKVIKQVKIRSIKIQDIHNTIGIKQGCPLSLFGLYIDELEMLIMGSLVKSTCYLLFGSVIIILLFVDDIILISYTTTRLQRQLDILSTYIELHGLEVNLQKIKIMISNLLKKDISSIHITYKGKIVDTATSYTYL